MPRKTYAFPAQQVAPRNTSMRPRLDAAENVQPAGVGVVHRVALQ